MFKAIKANKVYTIDEQAKSAYLSQGYDIMDEDGKIIEHSAASAVSREKYDKVIQENESLKSENKKLETEVRKLKKNGED